jgi:hypothetical protein
MPQDILGNIHYSPKRCFEHCYAAPLETHRLFTPATRKICNEHGLFLRGSGHRLPTFCDEQKLKRSHLSSLRVRAIIATVRRSQPIIIVLSYGLS